MSRDPSDPLCRKERVEVDHMIRSAAAYLLLVMAPAAQAQQLPAPQTEVLTLDRAIALAQENNRQIKIASKEVDKANEAVLAMRTQRLPQFNLFFLGADLLTPLHFEFEKGALGDVNGSPVPAQNTTIRTPSRPFALTLGQATQPLSQLYRIHLGLRGEEIGVKLQEAALLAQRRQTANSVKHAYYELLVTQSAMDAATESLATFRELDRITEQYFAAHTVLKYQSLSAKSQLAQAEVDLLILQGHFATQKESLNDLLGRDVRTEYAVSMIPDEMPAEIDIEAARTRALADRTEVREAQLKIEQATYDQRAQKAQYIPDVSLSFTYLSSFSSQVVPKNIAAAGIAVGWDVFDWGYKRHLLEQKKRTTEESRVNLSGAQSQVLLDVDAHFRKLNAERARLQVARLVQEAEKEKLRVVVEEYKLKATLFSSVLQEQGVWAQVNANYEKALAAFWSARADFEKSLGED